MTNITGGFFFCSNPINENEPPESGATFTYSIGLLETPEILQRCQSINGFYMGQLGFELVSHDDMDGDSFNLEIAIYGNVNPGYNAALGSLFGVEIGQILTQTGDVYERTMQAHWEEVENEEEGANEVKYVGGIAIVEQLLDGRMSDELADQVLHRLMANSVFL